MKRTVLHKRWGSGESAGGQVVESELCTTAPGGLLSRDFHAVSLAEFHLDTATATPVALSPAGGRWEGSAADRAGPCRRLRGLRGPAPLAEQIVRCNSLPSAEP